METKPRSNPGMCARCTYAKLMHGRLGGACSNFVEKGSKEARELPTVVGHEIIDSAFLDRMLLAATIEHQNAIIKKATQATIAALAAANNGAPRTSARYSDLALKALGDLGAS